MQINIGMIYFFENNSRSKSFGRLLKFLQICLVACTPFIVSAHPMPNSTVLIDLNTEGGELEIQLPLNELELAFGHDVNKKFDNLVARLGADLEKYLLSHIKITSNDNHPWTIALKNMSVQSIAQSNSGPYSELIVQFAITPPEGANPRSFNLYYDAIIHQVSTHEALIFVRKDAESGINGDQPTQIGSIGLDIPTNTIQPFSVNLATASGFDNFKNMVQLGISHIAEGTDHLMFLLVLLLPAPLLSAQKRWRLQGGLKYCIRRLLHITLAFTIGHSVTLLLGALGWVTVPSQPIEMLIAFSILVSAIHAIRPLFANREAFVALGFGFIHGLAFASTLAHLNLSSGQMVVSILGFNVGIELMQLLVVAVTVPSLILLSRSKIYDFVRVGGAIFAIFVSIAWLIERALAQPNIVTQWVTEAAPYGRFGVLGLALLASLVHFFEKKVVG